MGNTFSRLVNWLGFYKRDSFEQKFFDDHNLRSSIYMSTIVCILEVWVMILVAKRSAEAGVPLNWAWAKAVLQPYVFLLTCGLIVLVYSSLYYFKKVQNRMLGHILVIAFCVVCLRFGINVGVHDYGQGNQILAFITMIIYIGGLYALPAFMSFLLISGSYILFYWQCAQLIEPSFGFKVNLFTTWVSLMLVSLAVYRSTVYMADANKELVKTNAALQDLVSYDTLTGNYSLHEFATLADAELLTYEAGERTMLYTNIENFPCLQ